MDGGPTCNQTLTRAMEHTFHSVDERTVVNVSYLVTTIIEAHYCLMETVVG